MQFTPFWNELTPEHIEQHTKYRQLAQGLCLNCNKPLGNSRAYLCNRCYEKLLVLGLEPNFVSFGHVGQTTINYQQHLHRRLFGCNVGYIYRGLAEDRLRCDFIKDSTIETACAKLRQYLSKDRLHSKRYHEIKNIKNFEKRILFTQLLYAIAYYIEDDKAFKSKVHYQATVIHRVYVDVMRLCKRIKCNTHGAKGYFKELRNTKQMIDEWHMINKIVTPLLVEVVKR